MNVVAMHLMFTGLLVQKLITGRAVVDLRSDTVTRPTACHACGNGRRPADATTCLATTDRERLAG